MNDNTDNSGEIEAENNADPLLVVLHSVNTHMNRVLLVIGYLHKIMPPPPESEDERKKGKIFLTEILRSQIVLLHAILEDSLREVLRFKLKHDLSPEFLKNIPLVGISEAGQPKKFGLDDLVKHSDKSVGTLIEISIDEYLDKTSFTSSQSIATLLQKADLDFDTLKIYFPTLDKMITRRHQIVHRADRVGDIGEWQISTVDHSELFGWLLTVYLFIIDVSFLASPDDRQEFYEEFSNKTEIQELRTTLHEFFDKGPTALDALTLQKKLQDK